MLFLYSIWSPPPFLLILVHLSITKNFYNRFIISLCDFSVKKKRKCICQGKENVFAKDFSKRFAGHFQSKKERRRTTFTYRCSTAPVSRKHYSSVLLYYIIICRLVYLRICTLSGHYRIHTSQIYRRILAVEFSRISQVLIRLQLIRSDISRLREDESRDPVYHRRTCMLDSCRLYHMEFSIRFA